MGRSGAEWYRRNLFCETSDAARHEDDEEDQEDAIDRVGGADEINPEDDAKRLASGRPTRSSAPGPSLRLGASDMDAPGEIGGKSDVVAQRQLAKRSRDLKGPGEAEAAHPVRRQAGNLSPFKPDRSGGRSQRAGDQIEGRRLPDPFGPMSLKISPCWTTKST